MRFVASRGVWVISPALAVIAGWPPGRRFDPGRRFGERSVRARPFPRREARRTLEETFRPGYDHRIGSDLDFFGSYWLRGESPRIERERDLPSPARIR